jgi:hypothetical protein
MNGTNPAEIRRAGFSDVRIDVRIDNVQRIQVFYSPSTVPALTIGCRLLDDVINRYAGGAT